MRNDEVKCIRNNEIVTIRLDYVQEMSDEKKIYIFQKKCIFILF